MADCKIVNESVKTAIENIGGSTQGSLTGIAKSYKDAGDAFIEALKAAISEMEGETKDALMKFFTEGEQSVQTFVTESLPNAINSMSVLLEANRENFEKVDQKIAESISGGGQ